MGAGAASSALLSIACPVLGISSWKRLSSEKESWTVAARGARSRCTAVELPGLLPALFTDRRPFQSLIAGMQGHFHDSRSFSRPVVVCLKRDRHAARLLLLFVGGLPDARRLAFRGTRDQAAAVSGARSSAAT